MTFNIEDPPWDDDTVEELLAKATWKASRKFDANFQVVQQLLAEQAGPARLMGVFARDYQHNHNLWLGRN